VETGKHAPRTPSARMRLLETRRLTVYTHGAPTDITFTPLFEKRMQQSKKCKKSRLFGF